MISKENNFHHYYISQEHRSSDYFTFSENILGKNFTFKSCQDVFSKNEVDFGSLVLIKSIIEHKDIFGGEILDLCCGYGAIAIILSKFIDTNYNLIDINSTATELAVENLKLNNCANYSVTTSNALAGVDKMYDHIVSNPPIKVGKKVLFDIIQQAYNHINPQGTLTVVIKKNLGADSLKTYIISLFNNCEIWERDKGYYILHAVK